MENKANLWNLLHEGSIVAFSRDLAGKDINVKANIKYLCQSLATKPEFLSIKLRDCRGLSYRLLNKSVTLNQPDLLGNCSLEILRAEENCGQVSVFCTEGIIDLDHSFAEYILDDGSQISLTTLLDGVDRYWTNFKRHEKNDM
ncbi:MAG: hypothetical protein AAGG02_19275 [Cyanobacteria bacterium P01_H01_bin.15]